MSVSAATMAVRTSGIVGRTTLGSEAKGPPWKSPREEGEETVV